MAENTTILAFFILFAGVFLLLLPALMEIHKRWLRFMDDQVFVVFVILVLLGVLVVSSWAVWLTREEPALLLPLGLFTIAFRVISPTVLARTITLKLGPPTARVTMTDRLMVLFMMLMGGYALYASLKQAFYNDDDSGSALGFESIIMTITVIYSFSRFYFFIVWEHMRDSRVLISWVAGLIIGVAFVLMVPEVLGEEYLIFFGLAGACGWWLAVTLLHLERNQRSQRLLRVLHFT